MEVDGVGRHAVYAALGLGQAHEDVDGLGLHNAGEPARLDELADIRQVALRRGRPVGYAYACAHRARAAYRSSVETSAYVQEKYQRQGIGRALYTQLLRELGERGFVSAFAGITLPNDASVGFHESMDFEPIGVFPRVGWKLGAWHDVAWFYRPIRDSAEG